jgi:(p)ppGpp synthase/HD superfamily hydrolase
MMVAVLHDVVEDTDWTIDKLRSNGFPEVVLTAVESVTHREGESYDAFVVRAAANPIARKVKLADLEDNMDVRRIDDLADRDLDRIRKYHHTSLSHVRRLFHRGHECRGPTSFATVLALRVTARISAL